MLCFICIGSLAKVCAIMDGVANVDHHLETIKEVAEECADMNILLEELRNKILSRISHMPHPHVVSAAIYCICISMYHQIVIAPSFLTLPAYPPGSE